MQKYIIDLNVKNRNRHIGNKARNLCFLIKHHFEVPIGWVCVWDARNDFLSGKPDVLELIRRQLGGRIKEDKAYAVRSSGNVEDERQCSFAGQFMSVLKVSGLDQIIQAILDVWQSADSPEVLHYQHVNNVQATRIEMAVIIQEMVPAVFSGIAFSKNPLTGLSEIIVEAGSDLGDQLMQKGFTPERWISKWGNWKQQPDSSTIPENLIEQVVEKTAEISRLYGEAADLEWAYGNGRLFFVQLRRITRLDIPVFSNRISREMLPGIIKPLVWSVNTRLINEQWVKILTSLTGDKKIKAESLTGHFYYRAYFNMAIFGNVFERLGMPYEAIELLLGLEAEGPDKPRLKPGFRMLLMLPHFISFGSRLFFIERHLAVILKNKKGVYQALAESMTEDLTPQQLISTFEQINTETQLVAQYNILVPLLAMLYHKILTNLLKKIGIDARDLDLRGIRVSADDFSPHSHLERLHQRYFMDEKPMSEHERQEFDQDIKLFLTKFGHFSDSGNDFSVRPWRETPELITRMVAGAEPAKQTSGSTSQFSELIIPFWRRGLLNLIYRRTCRFAVHREAISFLYTYGYGQFRTCFLTLADHLVKQDWIGEREDIFFLYLNEVRDIIGGKTAQDWRELIRQRKDEIALYRDICLPETIFGTEQPPAATSDQTSLQGIPTSLGTYTGPVRVLQGLADFDRLQDGDVLVIPYSDVGWTPLFSKAGAVIAESGGMLSHSSIVARENRIPAIVSVAGACRIPELTIVTVNGYTGKISINLEPADQEK